ncbi:hypothetical protein ACHAW6_004786, partial [Cyclotella cf. meneghiniana]
MYPPSSKSKPQDNTKLKALLGLLSLATIALLASTIALAVNDNKSTTTFSEAASVTGSDFSLSKASSNFFASDDANACAGAKLAFDNQLCADLEIPGPQAGGYVTKGYVRNLAVDVVPNTKPYYQSSMCPVNVHWHLGSEHFSYGEYNENGDGPHGNIPRPDWAARYLAESGEEVPDGFRCHH